MSESFVLQIATGSSNEVKTRLSLNGAGTSPANPILRGLGMDLHLVFTPGVAAFELKIGLTTPPSDRILIAEQIDNNHWRVRDPAGEGQFELSGSYVTALRHFFRIEMSTESTILGTEREAWIEEDPTIRLGVCIAGLVSQVVSGVCEIPTLGGCGATADPFDALVNLVQAICSDTGECDLDCPEPCSDNPVAGGAGSFFQGMYQNFTRDGLTARGVIMPILEAPPATDLLRSQASSYDSDVTFTPNGEGAPLSCPGIFNSSNPADMEALVPSLNYLEHLALIPGHQNVLCAVSSMGLSLDAGDPDAFLTTLLSALALQEAFDLAGVITGFDPSANAVFVEAGPDRIIEVSVCRELDDTVRLPIDFMPDWKDEFNQKHFGGAKYVSIFEEGLTEDFQGPFVENVYQGDVTTTSEVVVLVVDGDHEYRVVCRFRSELNDPFYVDKLVRFRFKLAANLEAPAAGEAGAADYPDIIQVGSNFQWSGGDLAMFTSVYAYVDGDSVPLPITTGVNFPAAFNDQELLIYGGEMAIVFHEPSDVAPATTQVESIQTYRFSRPNGPTNNPLVIEKAMSPRRFLNANTSDPAAFAAFRLIEPSLASGTGTGTPGPVFLEVVANHVNHKAVVAYTDKGSKTLDVPLRPGRRYDVSDLFDINSTTGGLVQDRLSLLLFNETTVQLHEVVPILGRPLLFSRVPLLALGSSDFVIPDVQVDYPDVTIDWPAQMEDAVPYEIRVDAALGTAPVFWIVGDLGILRLNGTPGSTVMANLATILSSNRPRLGIFYAVTRDPFSTTPVAQEYYAEFPTVPIVETVPSDGFMDGPVKMILFQEKVIITVLPGDVAGLTVIGDLGTFVFPTNGAVEQGVYDLSAYISPTTPTVDVTYAQGSTVYSVTLNRFYPNSPTITAQFSVNGITARNMRMLDCIFDMPFAKIDPVRKTIQFDFRDRFSIWRAFSIVNPLDGTRVLEQRSPPMFTEIDISLLFPQTLNKQPMVGQRLVVTMLHQGGSHKTSLYQITGEFEPPQQMDFLLGQL